MRPGPRLLQALFVLAAVSLAVPLLPLLVWPLLAAVAAAAAVALVEGARLRRIGVVLDERPLHVLSLDEPQEISFRLHTDANRPLRLELRRRWPALLEAGAVVRGGLCRPGEALDIAVPVRAVARGTEPLEGPHVALSLGGWAERIVSVPSTSSVKVMPNLKAVARLHRKLNDFILRGMGQRAAPRLGQGREFDRLREYSVSDDMRDISWKASARHGKLIVREYRLDRSQDVLIGLDTGHRMAALTTRIRRIDHAVNAAMLVAYLCNRMEDRVGLLSFGAQVDAGIPQGRGASHLSKITSFASSLKAGYVHTDFGALAAHVKRRLRRRALILLVTTLPESGDEGALVRAVERLRPTHLPLLIVLSDPALRASAESLPADRSELCRTLVARDTWTERRRMMEELRRRGAWVVDTGPEDAGLEAVNAYLEIKRRQLI